MLLYCFLNDFNFSECMVLGCLASWAVNILFQWDALPFYLVHILVWFLSDWIMLSVVQVIIDIKLLFNHLLSKSILLVVFF